MKQHNATVGDQVIETVNWFDLWQRLSNLVVLTASR